MRKCFSLLVVAAWMAGGPLAHSANADCGCGQAPQQTVIGPSMYITPGSPSGLSLRTRLRRLFGHQVGSPYPVVQYVQPAQASRVVETGMPHTVYYNTPVPQSPAMDETAAPAEAVTTTVQRPNFEVANKYRDQVGHEDDYSWITGHLFYVRADGGKWVVRYALQDQVDKYGGSVVLTPTVEMKNFREGDLVCVFGRVLDEGRASPSLGGALYRVNAINVVERSDP